MGLQASRGVLGRSNTVLHAHLLHHSQGVLAVAEAPNVSRFKPFEPPEEAATYTPKNRKEKPLSEAPKLVETPHLRMLMQQVRLPRQWAINEAGEAFILLEQASAFAVYGEST